MQFICNVLELEEEADKIVMERMKLTVI